MKNRIFWMIPFFSLLLGLSAFAQSKHWLHIHVDGEDSEQVRVNLPLNLVSTVLPILEEKGLAPDELKLTEVDIDGKKLTVQDMRTIWQAIKDEGSFELANVVSTDANVRVFLDGQNLMVATDEQSGEKVNVKIPVVVVDALLSGEGEQLNLTAAVEALSNMGAEDLVLVEADDARVRIWVDDRNEG